MSSLEPTANPEGSPPADAPDFIDSAAAGAAALRGSVLRGGAYAGTMLLSLISAPLLLRHLGLAGFGRYTTVIAVVTIAGGMTDAGLVTIAVREWASRRSEDRARVMGILLGIRIELSAVAVLIGVGFALVAGYDHVLVIGTLLAGIGMMEQVCADLLTSPLQGELRFGWASVIDLSRQSTLVLAIVALVLAGAGLQPFFAVSILSGGLSLVLAASLSRRWMSLRPTWRGSQRWAILRETLPYSAAAAVNTFYFQLTIIAMSLIATAEQTGYFATSFRITQVLVAVPGLAIGAAFPILSRAAHNDAERFRSATERMLQLSLITGTALVLGVVLIAPVAVRLIATDKGAPAIPVLQIQALALLATFPSIVAGYSLLALRKNQAVLIANVVALLTNLTLTLILVPLAQARGAAIAAATAEWLLGAGQLSFLWRTTGSRPPLRPALIVAAAGALGAAPLLVPVSPLIRTAWGLAMYVAVLALAGQLPPEIREALPALSRRSR